MGAVGVYVDLDRAGNKQKQPYVGVGFAIDIVGSSVRKWGPIDVESIRMSRGVVYRPSICRNGFLDIAVGARQWSISAGARTEHGVKSLSVLSRCILGKD